MSTIYVIWAEDVNTTNDRFRQIVGDENYRVLRRGWFDTIQAEDVDQNGSLNNGKVSYCIVFETN